VRRIWKRLSGDTALYTLAALAFLWRTLLFRTKFIAVTGSFGKTTAKDFLAAMLARLGPTVKTDRNRNGAIGISQAILRTRPWHRFVVMEIGTDRKGFMARGSLLMRPDVALILRVARTHTKEFRTLEATAAEKAGLLRFLRPGGTAVLNGDDPRVAAMAVGPHRKVVRFGSSMDFDVWARDAVSRWPGRLTFTAGRGGEEAEVRTRLVGTHWLTSVLGAMAVATACGATLAQAAAAVADIEPYTARMQPVELPSGAVLLRDENNGSIDSLEVAMEVLSQAEAQRRMLIISDCSDCKLKPRDRIRNYARMASQCGAGVVFIGDRTPDGAHGFLRFEDAAVFLRRELRAGDLALLRGRNCDHLSRLYFALLGDVDCHVPTCDKRHPCDECARLGFKPGASSAVGGVCAE
jgi:UDP-N-acetylmuramoyl-tripeptide--D-alanyl-D-alanine ligase